MSLLIIIRNRADWSQPSEIILIIISLFGFLVIEDSLIVQ